jgi:O-antigen/teichoic acid export membrane protein
MSTRRLLGWALGGQASSFVVTLLGSIILARLLSPREMGVYAIAVATVGILSILSTAGPAS